jgi:hypothetical protein
MHMPDEQGATRHQQLTRFQQATGKAHPDLTPPDVPAEAGHVWRWFMDLNNGRQAGDLPLTWEAVDAWARLTGRSLTAWEVDALRRMDTAWLRAGAEERRRRQPARKGSNG